MYLLKKSESIKETQQVKTSWEIQERRVVTDTVRGTNVKGRKEQFRRVIHISTAPTTPLKRMAALAGPNGERALRGAPPTAAPRRAQHTAPCTVGSHVGTVLLSR